MKSSTFEPGLRGKKSKKKYNNGKAWTLDGKFFFKPELTAKPLRIESYEDLKTL